jgi:hypothetical protein
MQSSVLRLTLLLAAFSLAACGGGDSPTVAADESIDFVGLRVEEIGATRAVVRFSTSRPTSCEAEYGLAEENLDRVAVDPDMGAGALAIEHEVALEDLAPATTYFYRARATDGDDRTFRSSIQQFTTPPLTESSLVNVALRTAGTTAIEVSSNFGGGDSDSDWGAHRAIDGRMSTAWATNGDGDDAFATFDFGQERTLVRFGFRSRQMADGSSIITQVRLIFGDGETAGPFDTPDPAQLYQFDIQPVQVTRTVRVEAVATTGGNTGALEIQFFTAGE